MNDLGGINILVVNSSAFAADTEGIFTHHAMSPIRLSELAAPYIRREAGSKLSGIVFISSLAAKLTFKGGAAFCASKHAVLGYAGCLFEDLREDGIKVSTILRMCPAVYLSASSWRAVTVTAALCSFQVSTECMFRLIELLFV